MLKMPGTITKTRLHTFHDKIGVSFAHTDENGRIKGTKQMYLTIEDCKQLERELKRFRKGIENKQWYVTRIIEKGISTNESDGKRKPIIL